MGYGTGPYDRGIYELESMKNYLSLSAYVSLVVFCDPTVAGHHECQVDMPH
jgi:hypothetical protein